MRMKSVQAITSRKTPFAEEYYIFSIEEAPVENWSWNFEHHQIQLIEKIYSTKNGPCSSLINLRLPLEVNKWST